MDLIVNGPVKAAIRRNRIQVIFNYFQSWEMKRLQHAASKDASLPPLFAPPKPTQSEGLLILFEVLSTSLTTPKFQESMKKCFVTVGLAPDSDGSCLLYSATRKGTLAQLMVMPQVQCYDEAVSVGELLQRLLLQAALQMGRTLQKKRRVERRRRGVQTAAFRKSSGSTPTRRRRGRRGRRMTFSVCLCARGVFFSVKLNPSAEDFARFNCDGFWDGLRWCRIPIGRSDPGSWLTPSPDRGIPQLSLSAAPRVGRPARASGS